MGIGMRKLITYSKSQYRSLVDQLESDGFELMSLLELHGSDSIGVLPSGKKLAMDVSSFTGILSGNSQLASSFELLIHQLPPGVIFIGDENAVNKEAYMLRTMFRDIENCGLEADEDYQEGEKEKRTLVSLSESEFEQVLSDLENRLIGQVEFKRSFESRSRSFRLFYALGEQLVLSVLLLGPSGVGKTEVAKSSARRLRHRNPCPRSTLETIVARTPSIP